MEITFYDEKGHPKTYLSQENDNSFYTWDGHAVAYLVDEKIYGWRGHHIGWLISGILYDINGYKVGSTREMCRYSVYSEYSKYSKYSRYSRYSRYTPHTKPTLKNFYAEITLIDFITQDKI